MGTNLINSENYTKQMSGKEVADGLVAKIDVITGSSILDAAKCMKNFVLYERKHNVDVVIAELPSQLVEDIISTIEKKGHCFDWADFGFLCIPFAYINNKRKITPHYTTMQNFLEMLQTVKSEMETKRQQNLYQICTAQNYRTVEVILELGGFKIIR